MRKHFAKTLIVLLILQLCVSSLWAQSIKIQQNNTSIALILKEIQKQSGYSFVYSNLLDGINNKV
ncbi:MAG: hypothetical protein IKU18_04765, partial [Bacteroidales bacterium]|nr:hypothetical protein [Bacteroidales bacterium]